MLKAVRNFPCTLQASAALTSLVRQSPQKMLAINARRLKAIKCREREKISQLYRMHMCFSYHLGEKSQIGAGVRQKGAVVVCVRVHAQHRGHRSGRRGRASPDLCAPSAGRRS